MSEDKTDAALSVPAVPVPAVPPVEKLLEWAVLDGVIRMAQVMSPDLQDSLTNFARRVAGSTGGRKHG